MELTVAFACEETCGLSAAPAVRSPKRGSTDGLVSSLPFGSRGANLLPPFGRETIRAAND